MRLVLVTGNPHKVVELAAALPGWQVEGRALDDAPDETGTTYADNARLKALAGRRPDDGAAWVVGEDSGIEVAALGGAPGIHSARWDDDGLGRLLRELEGVDERAARYVCAMVAVGPQGQERSVQGVLEGTIAQGPRGSEGFGYDPIFVPLDEVRTVAELGDAWKARSSHRARAAAALAAALDRPTG